MVAGNDWLRACHAASVTQDPQGFRPSGPLPSLLHPSLSCMTGGALSGGRLMVVRSAFVSICRTGCLRVWCPCSNMCFAMQAPSSRHPSQIELVHLGLCSSSHANNTRRVLPRRPHDRWWRAQSRISDRQPLFFPVVLFQTHRPSLMNHAGQLRGPRRTPLAFPLRSSTVADWSCRGRRMQSPTLSRNWPSSPAHWSTPDQDQLCKSEVHRLSCRQMSRNTLHPQHPWRRGLK